MLTNSTLFRRIQLQVLMNLTARALRQPPKRIWTMPCGEALRAYAEFTREHLAKGADEQLLQRMGEEAWRMGRRLRLVFRLRRQADIERFTFLLYKNIGIRLEGHIPGELCFRHCYFSAFYTPAICQAASALDQGIISGLAGGGKLQFCQRITEGAPCCKATFENKQDNHPNT